MQYDLFQSLLESVKLTESHEDLSLVQSELFDRGEDTNDYAIALKDMVSGVTYAVDFKVNVHTGEFKIDRIDIQDHSYATPRVTDGNKITFELVGEFIRHNLKDIVDTAKESYL